MPGRGEYRRPPAPPPGRPAPSHLDRIRVREVPAAELNGETGRSRLDRTDVTSRTLAAELADEWVECSLSSDNGMGSARQYRRAIRTFCTYIDATVIGSDRACLGGTDPNLHRAVTEWVRALPAGYPEGS